MVESGELSKRTGRVTQARSVAVVVVVRRRTVPHGGRGRLKVGSRLVRRRQASPCSGGCRGRCGASVEGSKLAKCSSRAVGASAAWVARRAMVIPTMESVVGSTRIDGSAGLNRLLGRIRGATGRTRGRGSAGARRGRRRHRAKALPADVVGGSWLVARLGGQDGARGREAQGRGLGFKRLDVQALGRGRGLALAVGTGRRSSARRAGDGGGSA